MKKMGTSGHTDMVKYRNCLDNGIEFLTTKSSNLEGVSHRDEEMGKVFGGY